MKFKNIGVVADEEHDAQELCRELTSKYDLIPLDPREDKDPDVDAIIAFGGDGFLLHTLHDYIEKPIPTYGINCGTVGFLLNEQRDEDLLERLENARVTTICPLKMVAVTEDENTYEALAINEVSLLRKTGQAAKINISIDGTIHMEGMVSDGVLVATPAGSSAYNFSVNGPIMPLRSNLLALTPISPFRPRRWRGALLNQNVTIKFDVQNPSKRPVNAVADFIEVKNVVSVEVKEDTSKEITLLFDHGHSLEERIIREQFAS